MPTEADPLPHRLPLQPNPLLGRQEDIAALERLLASDNVRLLTLTGPPGTGKTSLATAVAHRSLPAYDQVLFIELAALDDGALVPSAIADSLGLRTTTGQELHTSVTAYLEHRSVLLVLDNMEHLLDASGFLAALLPACPHLKLLVTSRAPLRLRWEHQYPVAPLQLPEPTTAARPEELARNPAVALFIERANAVSPSFAVTDDNASAVVELCVRSDGLPLAIELAAAQTSVFSPEALLERLRDRLALPDLAPRDVPERHRTIQEAIAWSYSLLSSQGQALFRRSAVFVDGFTCEAAESVCTIAQEDGVDTLALITTLVEHNLLAPDRRSGPLRFRMLETIREFALECLQSSGEYESIAQRHGEHYLALAESAEPELWGPQERGWLDVLSMEQGNLRRALERFAAGDLPCGLRMAAALWRAWELAGHLSEGRGRLESMLEAARRQEVEDSAGFAAALLGAGYLARDQGDTVAARGHFEASLQMAVRIGDAKAQGSAERALGVLAMAAGDLALAQQRFQAALISFQAIDHQLGVGWVLRNLGIIAQARGQYEVAASLFEESLSILRSVGDTPGIARCRGNLGILARVRGDLPRAEAQLAGSLEQLEQSADQRGICMAWTALAVLYVRQHKYEEANALLRLALDLAGSLGDIEAQARGLSLLGALLIHQDSATAGLTLIAAASDQTVFFEADETVFIDAAVRAAEHQLNEADRRAARCRGVALSLADAAAMAHEACEALVSLERGRRTTSVLSRRELEVMRCIAEGKTNRQIAEQLVLSEFTVMRHVSNILRKLDSPSRAAAVSHAGQLGLL